MHDAPWEMPFTRGRTAGEASTTAETRKLKLFDAELQARASKDVLGLDELKLLGVGLVGGVEQVVDRGGGALEGLLGVAGLGVVAGEESRGDIAGAVALDGQLRGCLLYTSPSPRD